MSRVNKFIKKVAQPTFYIVAVILVLLFIWVLWETYQAKNLGFASKTLWDWMELLLVPSALAAAGLWFSYVQKQTEIETAAIAREVDREIAEKERDVDRELALDRQRQQIFENYLLTMKELILEWGLGNNEKPEVKKLAQTWTYNVLRELDAKRNIQVFTYLQESNLTSQVFSVIDFGEEDQSHRINLAGISLEEVNLENIHLFDVDLSEASLKRANLQGADLQNISLRGADLEGANLQNATLQNIDLNEANLEGANLKDAYLFDVGLEDTFMGKVDLTEAKLTDVSLLGTNLNNANLTKIHFTDVEFAGVDLGGANLSGVNLRRLSIDRSVMKTVIYDEFTEWPWDKEKNLDLPF